MAAGPVEWSTTAVADADAFDYWRDKICDEFVQLSARPRAAGPFRGHIVHRDVDTVQLSTVTSGAQLVSRTRSLIARGHEEYVLASIQLDGAGVIRQDGRGALLGPGALAFYDSTRPYQLSFDGPFRQLVVQVPRRLLAHGNLASGTAVGLAPHGPARLVVDFFRALAQDEPDEVHARQLAPHAVGLLDFALGLATDATPATEAPLLLERVHRAISLGAADPGIDAGAVAAACRVSRRTLFRVLAEHGETFTVLLRAERVRRAAALLRDRPRLPVAAVAARCGFLGEAQLHRAFRRETGTTPGRYRAG